MEIESDENEFLVELQKLMTSEVASTIWANNMDLFALTTFDNIVELYRISFKAQKVFQTQEDKKIKGLAFSPDSQLLAYGLTDGSIKILKTENGEQILSLDNAHTQEVQALTFIPYHRLESTSFMPFQKNSLESKLILNISPHKKCNRNAIVKINYFTQLKKDFTLLLSSDRNKTLFLLNGFLPMAEINYQQLEFSCPKVLFSHYDGKIRTILGEQKGTLTELWLLQCQAKVIEEWKEPVIKASCLLGYISEVLNFVESAYEAAELILRDALRQYKQKIRLIDEPNVEDFSPCEQLFRFLNCGTTSNAIVNFFTKEVYDTKILEKLDESINQCFTKLHDLLLQSIQNSLERAALLLCKLQDMSKGDHGKKLGLDTDKLKAAQSKMIKLYTMGEVLLIESTEAKFDIRNLLVWLNKATIKSAGQNEAEIENSKSYLNKYTVDFTKLHSFLCNQNKFMLQTLTVFFSKNQNDRSQIRIPKPDFNIFKGDSSRGRDQQERDHFNKFAAMLEVEDVVVRKHELMETEESYKSFKFQMKDLKEEWKRLVGEPVRNVSSQLKDGWKRTKMGTIEETELFPFEMKTVVKEGELFAYFVERLEDRDRIVQFNCHKNTRETVVSIDNHILNLAVSDHILTVIENKFTGKKIVAQIANAELNDGEIEIGKRITRVEGQLDIDCSLRGLNSLIVDKSKLIIFD